MSKKDEKVFKKYDRKERLSEFAYLGACIVSGVTPFVIVQTEIQKD